ncbi:MAG TPA: hypothetical protein VMA34_04320 [Terracidiphilus sp.]|nr:hypothetical protein [Terracidiphilus sp.]
MNEITAAAPPAPTLYAPMNIGQILDRTYRLTRANLWLFMGIAVVPTITIYAIMTAAMGPILVEFVRAGARGGSPPAFPVFPIAALAFASNLLPVPVFALYMSAAAHAATQADLGVKVTFRQSYTLACRRFGRSLWLMVLLVLYVYGPLLLVGGLIGGGALLIRHGARGGPAPEALFLLIPLAVLFYFAFLVYCVLIMLRFAFAYPASVAEDIPAWRALNRSTALTCGARGRIFLVLLVVYAAAYLVSIVGIALFFILGAIGAFAAISAHVTVSSPAFYVLIGIAITLYLLVMTVYASFLYAAFNTALAVLYHEQRRRKDSVPAAAPAPA